MPAETTTESIDRMVLGALHGDGSTMTAAEARERTGGLPVGTVRASLGRLVEAGKVEAHRHPQPGATVGTCLFYGVVRPSAQAERAAAFVNVVAEECAAAGATLTVEQCRVIERAHRAAAAPADPEGE